MTDDGPARTGQSGTKPDSRTARQERQAAALRENLRRRTAQRRDRRTVEADSESDPGDPRSDNHLKQ